MNKLGINNAFIAGLRAFIRTHVRSERGATAVEYGLLVGLIAVVIAVTVITLGGNLKGLFSSVATDVG